MAENRVLLRMTESELVIIINNLKAGKLCTHGTLLFNDLDNILSEIQTKAKEIEEYEVNGNGKSIVKDEEHTTNDAKLYHGPLYCEKCE